MGGLFTKYSIDSMPLWWRRQLMAIKLEGDDIIKLYKVFSNIKRRKRIQSNDLPIHIFLENYKVNQRPLQYLIKILSYFKIGEEKANGMFDDFREFALSIWNFLTMDKDALIRFTFYLYDEKYKYDILPKPVLVDLVRDLYGQDLQNHIHSLTLMVNLEDEFGGTMGASLESFIEFADENPYLFGPILAIQERLHRKCLSISLWLQLKSRRDSIPDGVLLTFFTRIKSYEFTEAEKAKALTLAEEERQIAEDGQRQNHLSSSIKLVEPIQINETDKRKQMLRKFKTPQDTTRNVSAMSDPLIGPGGARMSRGDSDVKLTFVDEESLLPVKAKLRLADPLRQMALKDAMAEAVRGAKKNARKKAYVVRNFERRRCYPEKQPIVYVGNSD